MKLALLLLITLSLVVLGCIGTEKTDSNAEDKKTGTQVKPGLGKSFKCTFATGDVITELWYGPNGFVWYETRNGERIKLGVEKVLEGKYYVTNLRTYGACKWIASDLNKDDEEIIEINSEEDAKNMARAWMTGQTGKQTAEVDCTLIGSVSEEDLKTPGKVCSQEEVAVEDEEYIKQLQQALK